MSSTQTASYVGASGTVTDTVVTSTYNTFDGVGNLTQTSQTSTDNGSYSSKYPSTSETISYTWFGSAEENVVSYKPDTSKGTTWTTTYSDTPNGATLSAVVVDGMSHNNSYVTNAKGQIISRWMNYSPTAQQDLLYIFGGKMMGELSNDGTPADQLGAQQGVISANNVPSSNLWTNTTPVAYANMTESYDPVDPASVGNSSSTYMVVAGDTLQSIAQQQWGDSSLWYLIADANGLADPNAALVAGTPLTIPSEVTNVHFNASTSQPYNANDALGNVSPTQAKPVKDGQCGIGQVIVMIIAAVVTAILMPYATEFVSEMESQVLMNAGSWLTSGMADAIEGGSALALAAGGGDIAGQLVGMASRVQSKFNWKELGMTVLSAFVSGAVSGYFNAPTNTALEKGLAAPTYTPLQSLERTVEQGVLANGINQGLSLAMGMQHKFSWSAMAASTAQAVVMSGVTSMMNAGPQAQLQDVENKEAYVSAIGAAADPESAALLQSGYQQQAATLQETMQLNQGIGSLAGMVANAAVRTATSRTDFGTNLYQMVPEVISTLGDMMTSAVQGDADRARAASAKAAIQNNSYASFGNGSSESGVTPPTVPARADDPIPAPQRTPQLPFYPLQTPNLSKLPDPELDTEIPVVGLENSDNDWSTSDALPGDVSDGAKRRDVDAYGQPLHGRSNIANVNRIHDAILADPKISLADKAAELIRYYNYEPPDWKQKQAEINWQIFDKPSMPELDIASGSTIPAIFYGASKYFGADQNARNVVFALASIADAAALGQAAKGTGSPIFARARIADDEIRDTIYAYDVTPLGRYYNTRFSEEISMFRTPKDEMSVVISDTTGLTVAKQFLRGAGGRLDDEMLENMAGNTFSHFHPLGGNFSLDDIATGLTYRAREIRAVTFGQTFSMNFENAPKELLGNDFAVSEFIKGEKAAISANYQRAVKDGTLQAPSDPQAKNIFLSNYVVNQIVIRNPWIKYTVFKR